MYIKASAASWEMRFSSSSLEPCGGQAILHLSWVCRALSHLDGGWQQIVPCACGIPAELQPCSPGMSSYNAWKC